MGLPKAVVIHQLEDRVRIRIAGKRGDKPYFKGVSRVFESGLSGCELTIAPATGSLLIRGKYSDPERIFVLAEKHGLFARAKSAGTKKVSGSLVPELSRQIVSRINAGIKAVSFGQLDIPLAAFVLLIGHAVREIARGNLTTPSWFTALWFASNIYDSGMRRAATGQELVDGGDSGE